MVVEQVSSSTVPAGEVIDQTPSGGVLAQPGSAVTVGRVVGRGHTRTQLVAMTAIATGRAPPPPVPPASRAS